MSDTPSQPEFPEVIFRKAAPIDVPEARYPGFSPGVTTLAKGTVIQKGALPLPCDILFERDVAVRLRDGTVIYTDIFRPIDAVNLPAIVAWSPYGKEGGTALLDDFPFRAGVPKSAVSGLQKWEGPDPAYWCHHGYAIVNPDARGAFASNGDIRFWGTQEGRDGFDFIEWVAAGMVQRQGGPFRQFLARHGPVVYRCRASAPSDRHRPLGGPD